MSFVRCNLCRATVASSVVNEREWVRACPCGWTHQRCIRAIIQYVVAVYPGKSIIICPFCQNPFRIMPPPPIIASTLYNKSRRWSYVNKAITHFCVMAGLNGFLVMCGLINLIFIWSIKDVKTAISRNPLFISDACFCISGLSICLSNIPWEDTVLHVLRRCSHLPIIGGFMPTENSDVVAISRHRIHVVDGVLLPFFSQLTGEIVFFDQESKFRRFLIGGATFLVLKGFITMYYRQKKYYRICSMDILNYEPEINEN